MDDSGFTLPQVVWSSELLNTSSFYHYHNLIGHRWHKTLWHPEFCAHSCCCLFKKKSIPKAANPCLAQNHLFTFSPSALRPRGQDSVSPVWAATHWVASNFKSSSTKCTSLLLIPPGEAALGCPVQHYQDHCKEKMFWRCVPIAWVHLQYSPIHQNPCLKSAKPNG